MADKLDIASLRNDLARHTQGVHALLQRVDYLHVAAMRGDPRFAKAEYAKPDFDCAAFDADWRRRGKRVPDMEEVFG